MIIVDATISSLRRKHISSAGNNVLFMQILLDFNQSKIKWDGIIVETVEFRIRCTDQVQKNKCFDIIQRP